MSRDGRGTPGRFTLKRSDRPRLKLADLLRRRRQTLTSIVAELGFTTHAGLAVWCDRMGLLSPTPEEFALAFPPAQKVNSPQEGIIVLEALPVIASETGEPLELESDPAPLDNLTVGLQKKARRKKESSSPTGE
jgi:hypothetical protein